MNFDSLNLNNKKSIRREQQGCVGKVDFSMEKPFLLFNVANKAIRNKVNLNYWNESANLGDCLSPIIVNYILERKGINPK